MVDNQTHTNTRDSIDSSAAVLSVRDMSKTYAVGGRSVSVLENINFSVSRGEFIAITGASGSGKSTLLQLIGCLDTPTTGIVAIEGQNVAELSDNKLSELRQKTIGFVFQSFYLQPFLQLNDNLAVPAMFTKKKRSVIAESAKKLLSRVGLADYILRYPKELSGGQIQRAAIARALMNNPRILLADEPTGNLDSANSDAIINLFLSIRDTLGATIIVVTHDPAIAQKADRVITLKDGKIL